MINLARLTAGWGLGVLPRPSVWAHAYVQVFGFMALFIMGAPIRASPSSAARCIRVSSRGPSGSNWPAWSALPAASSTAGGAAAVDRGRRILLLAAALFCIVILRTLATGVPR
jgi:hypothetical protein